MSDILDLSLSELAAKIARREVRSVEATKATLDALEQHAPKLNALARLWPQAAMEAAEAADADLARGRSRGPLHGVPLAHKDMFYRKGELSELGSEIFKGQRAATTSTVLTRLDAAGAIDIGRLNMVEFALGITGHNPHTGHPKNAWDTTRVTGGSTSGGATSVAARLAWATLGSDTGGSIRIPSSLCGLVGIKATYGRVSRAGCMPLSFSLDHIGPLCRTAEDCALMLEVIAGADPLDRTTSPRSVPSYQATIGSGAGGLRIGFARGGYEGTIDTVVSSIEGEAMRVFKELGASVGEQQVPSFAAINATRRAIMTCECGAYHRELVRTRRPDYNRETLARMEPGFATSAVDYLLALEARPHLLEDFCNKVFSGIDILALPTSPVPTPKIADTDTGGDARFVEVANMMGGLVGPFNYLGLPAVSVPMGFDAEGCPLGLQLVGRPFAEALLLRAAHAFEKETGHTRKKPPRLDA